MLNFVIPLRDKSTTDNWLGVCKLLKRTLHSAASQSHGSFRILVVGHSLPDGFELPERCVFIPVHFDPPYLKPDDDIEHRLWLMRTDKGRKMLHGLARVRKDSVAYVMFLDADDLVSNRLAGFVVENKGANGWFFEYGYRMDIFTDGRPSLYWRKKFYHECGSSYILRADLAPFPDRLDDTADFSNYYVRRYVVHAYVKDNFEKLGFPLLPLPFYGAIYTFNGKNIFAMTRRTETPLYKLIQRLIKGRRITPALKHEFGMEDL